MKVRRPRARDLPLIGLCGLAGMTAYQLLLNTGERVVPAGTASLLVEAVFHTAQKPLLRRYSGFEANVYAMRAGTIFILPWSGSLLRALPNASASAIGSAVFRGTAPSAAGFVL